MLFISGCRYKLKNIEETEAAKKFLHEKRYVGQTKKESTNSWSHNADYFQRGKDYAEKLRRGLFPPLLLLNFGQWFISCISDVRFP